MAEEVTSQTADVLGLKSRKCFGTPPQIYFPHPPKHTNPYLWDAASYSGRDKMSDCPEAALIFPNKQSTVCVEWTMQVNFAPSPQSHIRTDVTRHTLDRPVARFTPIRPCSRGTKPMARCQLYKCITQHETIYRNTI